MTEVQIWQPQSAEITRYEPSGPLDDWIRIADQVVRFAEVICRSPFVPDGLRGSVPATAAAILTGRELGIPPMTSLANIHVIHGKPGLSALVMRALVLGQGHEWRDIEVTNTRVVVEGRRKGAEDWTRASFSTADAQTAKLALGGYPQDKLYARASARLARRAFADVIAGMPYSIEELEDGVAPDETLGDVVMPGESYKPLKDAEAKPAPAQRTARRRQAAPDPSPAQAAPAATATPPAGAGEALPPLPGEEEDPTPVPSAGTSDASTANSGRADIPDDRNYDSPGTVTTPQITAIWTVLSKVYGFGNDEKDQARMVCAHIVDHDLSTTTMLTKNEAKGILDTLGHWREQAEKAAEHPRSYMIALMAAQDGADGE